VSATANTATAVPRLQFAIDGCAPVEPAAVPTLGFALRIEEGSGRAIRSVLLDVQIQIAARQRRYGEAEGARLLELFGTRERWSTTLRTLPWTRATVVVPPFQGSTTIEVPVTCTYDLEVTAARYLAVLEEGDVPLELLFSGTVFFAGPAGLQTVRIAWDSDVDYRLPVSVYRQAVDRHFPNSAWLRLGRGSFDRLTAYKARHAFVSWEEAVDALMEAR
jgi:hypothetical protein